MGVLKWMSANHHLIFLDHAHKISYQPLYNQKNEQCRYSTVQSYAIHSASLWRGNFLLLDCFGFNGSWFPFCLPPLSGKLFCGPTHWLNSCTGPLILYWPPTPLQETCGFIIHCHSHSIIISLSCLAGFSFILYIQCMDHRYGLKGTRKMILAAPFGQVLKIRLVLWDAWLL